MTDCVDSWMTQPRYDEPANGPLMQIPNCDDPVFRAWCAACDLQPGQYVENHDVRVARLESYMQTRYDPSYDPESDPADDYLTRGL